MKTNNTEIKVLTDIESRIIEAAKEVFVRKGYESATMSDVATCAGIGRTALHYYYRTKEILFDAVFGQLMASFLPNIDRVLNEDNTMLQKLPIIIDYYIRVIRANPSFPTFVLSELRRNRHHLFQALMKNSQSVQPILRLKQQLEDEMKKGLLTKMPLIDVFTTIASLAVFPMLVKEPLTELLLDNNSEEFEHFLNRRKELIIDITIRMLTPTGNNSFV